MKIKELLVDSSKWTKGVFARDNDGIAVATHNPNARCWCLVGAIAKCYNIFTDTKYAEIFNKIKLEVEHPSNWNDAPERTFAEVKELVERLDI